MSKGMENKESKGKPKVNVKEKRAKKMAKTKEKKSKDCSY